MILSFTLIFVALAILLLLLYLEGGQQLLRESVGRSGWTHPAG